MFLCRNKENVSFDTPLPGTAEAFLIKNCMLGNFACISVICGCFFFN